MSTISVVIVFVLTHILKSVKIKKSQQVKLGSRFKKNESNPLHNKSASDRESWGENEWPSVDVANWRVSQEWRDFVSERLSELKPNMEGDETKWALDVVDFLDELSEADEEVSFAERDISKSIRRRLLEIFSSRGFALIDSNEWNPDLQRAVSVVRRSDVLTTNIIKKGSTGLSRNGKIIRKQEVKIEMKGN